MWRVWSVRGGWPAVQSGSGPAPSGLKVSGDDGALCSSQNHGSSREQRLPYPTGISCRLGLCCSGLCPQEYLKDSCCTFRGEEGEEGARLPIRFYSVCSKGLHWAPGTGDLLWGFLQILYAVIKSELLHFILPQFAHLYVGLIPPTSLKSPGFQRDRQPFCTAQLRSGVRLLGCLPSAHTPVTQAKEAQAVGLGQMFLRSLTVPGSSPLCLSSLRDFMFQSSVLGRQVPPRSVGAGPPGARSRELSLAQCSTMPS